MIVLYSTPPASAPEPRFVARSMFSFGTEDFLAFWIASNSVGLPSGSPPPVRAATSMFLINLANSLPRLASLAAFWCLVVAHLEWPLIVLPIPSRRCRSRRYHCRVRLPARRACHPVAAIGTERGGPTEDPTSPLTSPFPGTGHAGGRRR